MTVEIFVSMLGGCALVTSLITEAVKKLNILKSNNVLALVVSILVGGFALAFFFIQTAAPLDAINIMVSIAFLVANWLSATLGYDKVLQTINQIINRGA